MATSNALRITSQQAPNTVGRVTFPQKLYSMVNDTKNQDLIRWSEAGDSFTIFNHECFARQVLGRWFKHENFQSFIRQLNMYGFQKIPHLQQGVLRSETDTEYWNYAHSNFRRDQPNLLRLIQRKKQAAQQADDAVVDTCDLDSSPPTRQIDAHSTPQEITAIKHRQTIMSAEFNEFKQSQEQELTEAREEVQGLRDTVNRIVRFLAGVFGNPAANPDHRDDVVDLAQSDQAVGPHTRTRLMIEGGERESSGKVGIVEIEDPDATPAEPMNALYNSVSYATETPAEVPSPPLIPSAAGGLTLTTAENNYYGSTDHGSLFAVGAAMGGSASTPDSCMTGSPRSTTVASDSTTSAQPQPQPHHTPYDGSTTSSAIYQPSALDRAITSSRPPTHEVDPRIQGLFNTISQDQAAQLLAVISQTTPDANRPEVPSPLAQLPFPRTPATTFDFSSVPSLAHAPSADSAVNVGASAGSEGPISFNVNISRDSIPLSASWRATGDTEKDANMIDPHFNRLRESHLTDGLTIGAGMRLNDAASTTTSSVAASSMSTAPILPPPGQRLSNLPGFSNTYTFSFDPSSIDPNFDFEMLLGTLPPNSGMDGTWSGESIMNVAEPDTTFLDEIPSPASSVSNGGGVTSVTNSPAANVRVIEPVPTMTPTKLRTTSAGGLASTSTPTTNVAGRKRKSDVVDEMDGATGTTSMADARGVGVAGSGKEVGSVKPKKRKN